MKVRRLKTLAKKSGLLNRRYMYGKYYDDSLTDEQKEFARLIVMDVLDLCKKQKWHSAFNEYREGIRDSMKSIKDHFGVKE